MSNCWPPGEPALSPDASRSIAEACAQFEEAWRAGRRPAIGDFLPQQPTPLRSRLLAELLGRELAYRTAAGEQLTLSEYQQRFPEHRELVAQAFERAAASRNPPSQTRTVSPDAPVVTVTREQFLAHLVHSGLISAEELGHICDRLPPARDARMLAEALVREQRLTKYQARCLLQGKTRGLVLGKYVVLSAIGRGGMGQVYKARHCTMDRIVALKVLRPERMQSAQAVDRFRREVRAAAKLEHTNIVAAHDAGEVDGTHFLVMQYVDGTDLARLVEREGPLPIAQAVNFVLQAARGLEYAHRQGIVHRDIKPSNLIVDQDHTVKILDMGLASIDPWSRPADAPQTAQLTDSWQVLGTVEYMSPEQAEDTHAADHRADIYSLGCTLYRLLIGRPPYTGETVVQILVAHRQDPIPSLRASRPDVPAQLDAVCRKMMAKQAAERQQTMTEVVADLEACASVVTDTTPPPAEAPVVEETLNLQADHDTVSSVVRRLSSIVMSKSSLSAGDGRRPVLVVAGVAVVAFLLLLGLCAVLVNKFNQGGDQQPVAASNEPGKTQDDRSQVPQGGNKTRVRAGKIRPSWEVLWTEAEAKAKPLLDERRYAQAQAVYSDLLEQTSDAILKARVESALAQITEQAVTAYAELENRTRQLLAEQKFAESRAALESAVERFAIAPHAEAAKTLLAEIAAAEAAAAPVAPPPPVQPSPEELAAQQELERRRALEARYAEATKSAEVLAASWDFQGAAVALSELQFAEAELTARLVQRRGELQRMHDLKQKLIAAINQASPQLRKSDLGIKGVGGNVTKANEDGVTTTLLDGNPETIPWPSVGTTGLDKLFSAKQFDRLLAPAEADDWLAAGLVALVQGSGSEAERCLEQARSLGMNIEPYLAMLAAASFAEANALLAEKQFSNAETVLAGIEQKYASTPWCAAHKTVLAAARQQAKLGIVETEAEAIYKEAVALLERKDLFDLKSVVDQLKADYPNTAVVSDSQRRPSFAELELAVANLGKLLRVRLDGQGDFTSIQAAIDAAEPNSCISIEDNGPYAENLLIPMEKPGLTIRGTKGHWPVITSVGASTDIDTLLTARAPSGTTLERLVLAHSAPRGTTRRCVSIEGARLQLRSVILFMQGAEGLVLTEDSQCTAENSLLLVSVQHTDAPHGHRSGLNATNCLCLGPQIACSGNAFLEARTCVLLTTVTLSHTGPSVIVDSVVQMLRFDQVGHRIEFCDIAYKELGTGGRQGEFGRGCLTASPMFRDPANLDFRLLPGSPCNGKASDGGDIGCRYTPEMIDLCKVALDLRRRGILKF